MKCEAIDRLRLQHSVRKMCKVLGITDRAYYQWKKQEEKRNAHRLSERTQVETIHQVFIDSKEVYGARKIQKHLETSGTYMSEWKVRRIMRENGMYSVIQKKFRPYSNQKSMHRYTDNIVDRDFNVTVPNKIWVSDITYIKTRLGWYYLAAIIDLYNREVIGYSTSKNIDTELVKQAITNAIARYPEVQGTIFHSDRGSQYASAGVKTILDDYGMIQSMSKGGCPYDNSCMESFFAYLKKECIYRRSYKDSSEVEKDLFEYIELFYNRKRIHSTLNYMTPMSYRIQNQAFISAS